VWYKRTTNIAACVGMAVGYIATFGYLMHTEFFGWDFIQLFGSKEAILRAAAQVANLPMSAEIKAQAAAMVANAASVQDGALAWFGNIFGAQLSTDTLALRGRLVGRLWSINNISGGIIGVPLSFLTIWLVSMFTPAPSKAMQDFIEDIRVPRGGVRLADQKAAVE
jgi:cation/acetate symporter